MINLEKNEKILLEVRKHWFSIAMQMLVLLFIAIAPIFIYIFISYQFSFEVSDLLFIAIFFYASFLLILWITVFLFWTNYYLDTWIITDKKIIDIEQVGLFHREISLLHLDKVQDVTSEVRGILATFIDYGEIHVQTAGQQREFILTDVPNPNIVREKINEALTKFRQDHFTLPTIKNRE